MAQKAETCGVESMKLRDGGTTFLLCVLFVGFVIQPNKVAAGICDEYQIVLGSVHSGPSPKEQVLTMMQKHYGAELPVKNLDVGDWEEFNPGFVCRKGDWYAGYLTQNSWGKEALLAGYVWDLPWDFSINLGGISGYPEYPVLPDFGLHYTPNAVRYSLKPYTSSILEHTVNFYEEDTGEFLREEVLRNGEKYLGVVLVVSWVFK